MWQLKSRDKYGLWAPPSYCQKQTQPCNNSSQTAIVTWAVPQVNKRKHGSIVMHVVNPHACCQSKCMVLLPAHLPLKCVAIIPTAVCWVRAGGVGGVLCEGLRVAFWIKAVSHARAMWVDGAIGAMQLVTTSKRVGCASLSGNSTDTMRLYSSSSRGLWSECRMSRMCAWGRPLFCHSMTWMLATTSPKMPFFKSSSSKCYNLRTKTRVTKSGRSLAISPGFSVLTISSHLGL